MLEKIESKPVKKENIREALLSYLNSRTYRREKYPLVLRLALPIEELDLLSWLRNQPHAEKLYWYDKNENLEVAGIGVADIVFGDELSGYASVIRRILKYSSARCSKCRYYGGFSFYKNLPVKEEWKGFGAYQFILPKFEIVRNGEGDFFICNLIHPDDNELIQLVRNLDKISFNDSSEAATRPVISEVVHHPDKKHWQDMIYTALRHIQNDEYEKIVLARKVEIDLLSQPDPFTIISALRKTNHHTVSFCFQPQEDMIFLGVTPEILYRRDKREIISEAVAGTRPRGENEDENEKLANELISSEKELREHGYVSTSLKRNLSRLCKSLNTDQEVSVLKLSQIQHLYVPFSGNLHNSVTDGEILEALHPTPAVGGYPEKSVLPTLREAEPFNRGWYAAPVGWTAADSATFAVAIRSALVVKNKIFLYSGAGIVEGSSPDKEWAELDNKIEHYKKILEVDGKSPKKHQQLLGIPAY
jgi:menaquinone-specific isochorismate synthase